MIIELVARIRPIRITVSFALLCCLHASLALAAATLPLRKSLNEFEHFEIWEVKA